MTVAWLVATLQLMPQDLDIVIDCPVFGETDAIDVNHLDDENGDRVVIATRDETEEAWNE